MSQSLAGNSIRPFNISEGLVDWSVLTHMVGRGSKVWNPNYIWYIEGPKEKILVDTSREEIGVNGLDRHGTTAKGGGINSIRLALRKIDLAPEDIDIIINTHLHYDHCSNNGYFSKARFVLQKDELETARCPVPAYPSMRLGYPPLSVVEQIEKSDHELVDGDKQIADGVAVIKLAGHSRGMQGVAVETERGRAIICGDAVYRWRNWYPMDPTFGDPIDNEPHLIPGYYTDMLACYESFKKLERLADLIIPGAEPEFDGKRIPGYLSRPMELRKVSL
jgi:N-acyl homoserine lactone hydrolase